MLRSLAFGVAGLVIGVVIVAISTRGPDLTDDSAAVFGSEVVDLRGEHEIVALRADMELRLDALERSMADVSSELEALRRASQLGGSAAGYTPDALARERDETRRRLEETRPPSLEPLLRTTERDTERLLAAGFTPERIEWIQHRFEQLRMEAMQAQYEAHHGGQPLVLDALLGLNPSILLREEMGDTEYERYLSAMDQPTSVDVRQVLRGSPAEQAGLQVGDEIIAYDGKRVFDASELTLMTLERVPGESVVLDVMRDGQRHQVVVQHGPLGVISSSSAARRPQQ